jgi:hypothetical protein
MLADSRTLPSSPDSKSLKSAKREILLFNVAVVIFSADGGHAAGLAGYSALGFGL